MNKLNEKGNKEGLWREYHFNGKLYNECNYTDDKKNGLYKSYYDGNGQLFCECNYIDGKRNGLYKSYYDNGQLWYEGIFLMSNKIGLWKLYDRLCKLTSEIYYE